MKTNSLIRINSNPSTKRKPQAAMLKKNHFSEISNDVDQLWHMYQAQLQRNGELMSMIDHQQQFIQQVITKGITNSLMPEIPALPSSQFLPTAPVPEFKALSMDKFTVATQLFKELFPNEIKRLDGIQSIVKMLYILHQMGGSAFPKQLFEKTSVAASTGFRNAMILQNRYLIKKVGGKYDIRYKITHWGKQLLEGTLQKNFDTPFHQYADQDEGKKAWEPYDNLKE